MRARIRIGLPHLRQAPFRPDNRQPGRVRAPLQRDPVLGRHRNLHDEQPQQKSRRSTEIHQTGRVVSTLISSNKSRLVK